MFNIARAQVKVDKGYTILTNDSTQKTDLAHFLLADPFNMKIKEDASGKACSPSSIQCSFFMKNNEVFRTSNLGEIQKYLMSLQPKDKVIIDKIVLPAGCFPPPKQIVVEVM